MYMNPSPLQPHTAPPYPPQLHGLLGQTCQYLASCGHDPTIVTVQALAFASLLTQSLANVQGEDGHDAPLNASFLLRAPSGTGKSSVFRLFSKLVDNAIRKAVPLPESAEQVAHPFFVEDISRTALLHHLAAVQCAGLFTDEASRCSELVRQSASTLAKLISGESVRHARHEDRRLEIVDPRLTVLWMEQPGIDGVWKRLINGASSDVGVVNRLFVADVPRGRMSSGPQSTSRPFLEGSPFEQRVSELVNARLTQLQLRTRTPPPRLTLSPQASQHLSAIRQDVEHRMQGLIEKPVQMAYATRHVERCIRLAGVIQVFEAGVDGSVTDWAIDAAHQVGLWSLNSYVSMTYVPPKVSRIEQDAIHLWSQLAQASQRTEINAFGYTQARTFALNLGITSRHFDAVVAMMCKRGWAQVGVISNQSRVIHLTCGSAHLQPPY